MIISQKKFTNPIYYELLKYKLIKKKNLRIINKDTRDIKNLNVIQDINSKIIFLKKKVTDDKYYTIYNEDKKIKNIKKNSYTRIKNKNTIVSASLNDDLRRFFTFKKYLKNKIVLDFGCGWGGFLSKIKNAKKIYGVELRKSCLSLIKKRFKIINITNNLQKIPEKVDLITMFHVLEHMPYQLKILKDIKNKLKKNGKIIIEVPHANDFLLQFAELKSFRDFTFWSEHLILHTKKSLEKILKIAGFKKIKIQYFQRYDFNNHIGWFVKNIPGGHDFYKNLGDFEINQQYKNFLIKKEKTDTLIAIARSN